MTEEKPSFPTRRLHHVGVVVKDIEKAIAQMEALGFGPFKFDDEHRTFAIDFKGELHGEPAEWTTLISNGMMGDVELELLEPVAGDQALKETLDAQGEGLHHIGWLTTDLQGDMEKAKARGRQGLDQFHRPRPARLLLLRELAHRQPGHRTAGAIGR